MPGWEERPAAPKWEEPAAWEERPAAADQWAQKPAPAWEERPAAADAWSEKKEDPWAQSDPWAQKAEPRPAAEPAPADAAVSWGAATQAARQAPDAGVSWGAAGPPIAGLESSDVQKRARQKDFYAYQDWFVEQRILPGKSDDEVAEDEATFFKVRPFQGVGADFSLYDHVACDISGPNTDEMPTIQSFNELYEKFRDDIPDQLERNIRSCGYDRPTPVQKYAIPCAVAGRDVMCCAQTGSGKTAAFLVPMLASMIKNHRATGALPDPFKGPCKPDTLVLTPTRELCLQIFAEAQKFCHRTPFRVCRIYGKEAPRTQLEQLAKGADVVVATPGRLWDFVTAGVLEVSMVNCLVLDEADRMIDQGMDDFLKDIIENYGIPPREDRQTMMFSATFPAAIQELAKAYLYDHVWLGVGIVGGATSTISQRLVKVEPAKKYDQLYDMLMSFLDRRQEGERCMVFTNSKQQAKGLDEKLYELKIDTGALHGDLSQEERESNLQRFRDGAIDVLICTDVASRGLDIGGVSHIVNYDLPREIEVYVQRIGRTGRIGHRGEAISFVAVDAQGALQEEERMLRDLVPTMRDAKSEVPAWLQAHYDGVDNSWTDSTTWWERSGAKTDARGGKWEAWSDAVTAAPAQPAVAASQQVEAGAASWSAATPLPQAAHASGQEASSGSWTQDRWETEPSPADAAAVTPGWGGDWNAAHAAETSSPPTATWAPEASPADAAAVTPGWGGDWNAAHADETSSPPTATWAPEASPADAAAVGWTQDWTTHSAEVTAPPAAAPSWD